MSDALRKRTDELLDSAGPVLRSIRRSAEQMIVGDVPYARVPKPAQDELVEKATRGITTGADDGTEVSNALPYSDDVHTIFTNAGALFPPYDPEVLVTLYEHSNSLRPNVDAYKTNIEAFGHTFDPVIDTKSSEADNKIADAIFIERLRQAERGLAAGGIATGSVPQANMPTPAEVAQRKIEVEALMRLEHARITNFFQSCCAETSFIELRAKTRVDLEVTGNAYWEVLRNGAGEVSQFVYVPAHSMRLCPIDRETTDAPTQQKVSSIDLETVTQKRRFRRFVQVVYDRCVYFKEYGDPRMISRRDGLEHPNEGELLREDTHDGPATEVIHFRVHSPRSPYGVPRWIGNLLAVLGSRASEEVNYLYFDNKAVPPLAVLVSGGKLTEAASKKLETYVKDNIRGKENFHKILIVEAESAAGMPDNGRCRVVLQPLTEAQQQDALFQQYDQNNIDKVGMAFRMPRLLRGDIRDFNRATADAALSFTEMQVFQPERELFDGFINRRVMTELGIRFWTFASNSPVNRDPGQLTEMVTAFVKENILTIQEGREIAADVFNREFKKLTQGWANQPVPLTLAGMLPPDEGEAPLAGPGAPAGAAPAPAATDTKSAPATPEQRTLAAVAAQLTQLRGRMLKAEDDAWQFRFKRDKVAAEEEGVLVIPIPKAELDQMFEPE